MESAIASFGTCLSLDADFQRANTKLLQAYRKTRRQPEAIKLLEDSLARESSSEGHNTAGVLYYQSGWIEKAVNAFKNAIQINPCYQPAKKNLCQLYREQGIAALKAKSYSQATEYFSLALRINPTDGTLFVLMGEVHSSSGDFLEAVEEYKKALQLDPSNTSARQNLARGYSNLGVQLTASRQWDEAIAAYRKAFQLMPDFARAKDNLRGVYWKRANAYRESENLAKAIAAYRELIRFVPEAVDARSLLGELYFKNGEYLGAIEEFQAVLKSTPQSKNAQRNLIAVYHKYGQTLNHQKRYSEAIHQLQQGLVLEPAHINLRLSLGSTYQHAGEFNQSKATLEKVLEIAPDNLQAKEELIKIHIWRGNYLLNRKQYAAALTDFENISESRRDAGIFNTIGYLYVILGQPIGALPALEAALLLNPTDDVAYQNLRSIESQFFTTRESLARFPSCEKQPRPRAK